MYPDGDERAWLGCPRAPGERSWLTRSLVGLPRRATARVAAASSPNSSPVAQIAERPGRCACRSIKRSLLPSSSQNWWNSSGAASLTGQRTIAFEPPTRSNCEEFDQGAFVRLKSRALWCREPTLRRRHTWLSRPPRGLQALRFRFPRQGSHQQGRAHRQFRRELLHLRSPRVSPLISCSANGRPCGRPTYSSTSAPSFFPSPP